MGEIMINIREEKENEQVKDSWNWERRDEI